MFCPRCEADLKASEVNLDRLVAKCSNCDALFSVADQVEQATPVQPVQAAEPVEPPPAGPAAGQPASYDRPLPAGFAIDDDGQTLTIRCRWFRPSRDVTQLAFTGVTVAFLAFWLWMASRIATGGVFVVFGALYGVFVLVTVSGTVVKMINTTTVTVGGGRLSAEHGPIPVAARSLDAGTVSQLYCKRSTPSFVHFGPGTNTWTTGGMRSSRRHRERPPRYDLVAIAAGGQHRVLLKSLDDPDQALYLEQEIERFLRIADRPVHGEVDL